MTWTLASLKTAARNAAIGTVLSLAVFSANPAAAAEPAQNFSLELGAPSGSAEFGVQKKSGADFIFACLTNKQIRKGLYAYGFEEVSFVRNLKKQRVQVEALYDDWYYSMRVDRCTGHVDRVKKLYPADEGFDLPF